MWKEDHLHVLLLAAIASGNMPRSPTELDIVERMLQSAAAAIRDMPCGSLPLERLKTQVYHHVTEGINVCANYSFGHVPDCPPPSSTSSFPTGPSGRRGGGGGGGGGGVVDCLNPSRRAVPRIGRSPRT